MKKLNKKAFTIVELVIVIAVIAVLAAVLIPTFTRLIRRSKVNNDTAFIRELNNALAADKADGKEHNTMTDALNAANDFGLDVVKINAKASNNEFLWDSKNDVFCYLNDGTIEYYPNSVSEDKALKAGDSGLWKIYKGANSVPDAEHQTYAIYLGDAAAASTVSKVSVSIDCGDQTVENLTYENLGASKDAVIRTNSSLTALTIKAPNDRVYHYDEVGMVNVISSDSASYHENGNVSFLEVAGGHIVLESTAKVAAVHFTATNGEFKNADNKTISIDLSKVSEENMPEFSRDAVTIPENGKYVAEVTTDKKEFVWLFGNGIKEQMVATEQEGVIAENGELKSGVVAGVESGTVAEQIANPAKRNSDGALVDNNGVEIDVSSVDWSTNSALDGIEDIVYEELKTKEDAINENVIEYINTFAQLKDFVENGTKINGTIGADFDITGQIAFDRTIVLDLNGHKLSNVTTGSRPFNINAHADVTINGTTAGSEISMPASNIASYGLFFLNQDCFTLNDTANGIYGPSLILNGGTYSGTTNSGGMIKYKTFVSNIEMYGVTMVTSGGGLIAGDGSLASYYNGTDGYKHRMSYNYATIKDCNFTQGVADNGVIYNVGLSISGIYVSNGLIENTTIVSAHGCAIYLSNGVSTVKNCNVTVLQPNNTADWLGAAIGVAADATVTIDGGTYTGQQYGLDVYTSNGHVTINSGSFTGTTAISVRSADSYKISAGYAMPNVNIINGTISGNLSEGADAKLEIVGGSFTVDPTDYVDTENYNVNGENPYTVSSK